MNELAIIFDRMGIDTRSVIEAAGTKWNFHKYYPGLVGGHCISVDPFYLLHKARQLGYEPQVIAAGRRVNESMPQFIVDKLMRALKEVGKDPGGCQVLVMGITFKENVSDIRNSRVVDLVRALEAVSMTVDVFDPHADPAEVRAAFGIELLEAPAGPYDAVVVAVGHEDFKTPVQVDISCLGDSSLIVFDIKGIISLEAIGAILRL